LFYSSPNINGIYKYFRASELLSGEIYKPTGQKNESYKLHGEYRLQWENLEDEKKYCILKL